VSWNFSAIERVAGSSRYFARKPADVRIRIGRRDRRGGQAATVDVKGDARVRERLAVPAGGRTPIRPDERVAVLVDDHPDRRPVSGSLGSLGLDLDLLGGRDPGEVVRRKAH
jgi:hypothetical protein